MSRAARLGIILLVNAVAYAGVIALVAAAPRAEVGQ